MKVFRISADPNNPQQNFLVRVNNETHPAPPITPKFDSVKLMTTLEVPVPRPLPSVYLEPLNLESYTQLTAELVRTPGGAIFQNSSREEEFGRIMQNRKFASLTPLDQRLYLSFPLFFSFYDPETVSPVLKPEVKAQLLEGQKPQGDKSPIPFKSGERPFPTPLAEGPKPMAPLAQPEAPQRKAREQTFSPEDTEHIIVRKILKKEIQNQIEE